MFLWVSLQKNIYKSLNRIQLIIGCCYDCLPSLKHITLTKKFELNLKVKTFSFYFSIKLYGF